MNNRTLNEDPIPDADPHQAVDRALKRFGYQQDALIEVLHIAQQAFGYLPPAILKDIARRLKLPLSWVYGVASFYHYFSIHPPPDHHCVVCTGTACHVEGAEAIISAVEGELAVKIDREDPDGRFNLVSFRCPGSCGLAPIIVLDGRMSGRESPESVLAKIKAVLAASAEEAKA